MADEAAKRSIFAKLKIGFASMLPRKAQPEALANPFAPLPPPGNQSTPSLANDDALSAASEWSMSMMTTSSVMLSGFLGFPALSILSQHPEYRRAVEIIALEMTRNWVEITSASGEDRTDRIKAINDELTRLDAKSAFRRAAELDGFFGRGHLFLDFGNIEDRDELKTSIGDGRNAVSELKLKGQRLRKLKPVEPVWAYPSRYNSTDPLADDWYRPEAWTVQGKEIHSSRFLTFIAREVPDLLKPAYAFGGLSLVQMLKPYVDNWLRTRQSVSDLLHAFSVSGLKTDLADALEQGEEKLVERAKLYNAMRDTKGLLIIDKEEDFFQFSTPLSTLDHLQAQTQEHMASIAGIPLVKFFGTQPTGLNASSEGELDCFETWINSLQESLFRDPLTTVIDIIQLTLFKEIDHDIKFKFVPLGTLTDEERAALRKTEAETDGVLVEKRIISRTEARQRIISDPESGYSSLTADAAPDAMSVTDKADVAVKIAAVVIEAHEAGLISEQNALQELRAVGGTTGVFATISESQVAAADPELPEPEPIAAPGLPFPGEEPEIEQSKQQSEMDDNEGEK